MNKVAYSVSPYAINLPSALSLDAAAVTRAARVLRKEIGAVRQSAWIQAGHDLSLSSAVQQKPLPLVRKAPQVATTWCHAASRRVLQIRVLPLPSNFDFSVKPKLSRWIASIGCHADCPDRSICTLHAPRSYCTGDVFLGLH